MLLSVVKTLIALFGGLSPIGLYPPDYGPNLQNGDEFDFIVVGAGSAGSVVANRLSEISQWKILILEAGGYPSDISEIPSMCLNLQQTDEDWQYLTEPSKTCCLGLENQRCRCPRGKSLGGSSSINYMMYTRSTKYDHDRWVNDGNIAWGYNSVEKYYKKFENVHIEDNKHYGDKGDLHITRYTSNQPIRHVLSNAYEELGYQEYTEDKPIGHRDVLLSVYEGTRQSACKAFLSPVKDRKNLYVAVHSRVSKILVDPKKMTAFGVEVKIRNQILRLHAKNEVILSAGSFNSPQILLNSGVGPKEHLAKIGISVIQDLKVGENYQDHLMFPFLAVEIDRAAVTPISSLQLLTELYQFFINRQGKLSQIELLNYSSYINTKNKTNFADVQIIHALFHQNDPFLEDALRLMGAPKELSKTLLDYNKKSPFLAFFPILLHPKSSGRVRLRNADPFSKPVITPNFLNDKDDDDIKVMLDAFKMIKRLLGTEAFSSYDPKFMDLNITNCRDFAQPSEEFWACAIRNIAYPVYHPTSTCKMGPDSDPGAVVDAQLRVRGVGKLRVIDASVMPIIPSCNTNAPTLMIGEKGADMIKVDWRTSRDEL